MKAKRILSFLLCAVLIAGMLPLSASAADTTPPATITYQGVTYALLNSWTDEYQNGGDYIFVGQAQLSDYTGYCAMATDFSSVKLEASGDTYIPAAGETGEIAVLSSASTILVSHYFTRGGKYLDLTGTAGSVELTWADTSTFSWRVSRQDNTYAHIADYTDAKTYGGLRFNSWSDLKFNFHNVSTPGSVQYNPSAGSGDFVYTYQKVCDHTDTTSHPAVAATCATGGNAAYSVCNTCGSYLDASGSRTHTASDGYPGLNSENTFKTYPLGHHYVDGVCTHDSSHKALEYTLVTDASMLSTDAKYRYIIVNADNKVLGIDHRSSYQQIALTGAAVDSDGKLTLNNSSDTDGVYGAEFALENFASDDKALTLPTDGTALYTIATDSGYGLGAQGSVWLDYGTDGSGKYPLKIVPASDGTVTISAWNYGSWGNPIVYSTDEKSKTEGFTLGDTANVKLYRGEATSSTPEPAHTHDWAAAWTNNETHHWHECTAAGCDITENAEKNGYAAHRWNEGEVTTQPTESAPGVRTFTCQDCSATKTEEIPALDPAHVHNWSADWTNNATHHWHECTAAGCDVTANTDKDGYAAHTFGSWTEPSAGDVGHYRTCTVCGYREYADHTFGAWTEDAANDTHSRACSVCGYKETAAHNWDNGVLTKQNTCAEDGEMTFTCDVCGATKVETRPATGAHTLETVDAVDATCTEAGHTAYQHCTVCDKYFAANATALREITLADTVIAALGHDWDTAWSYDSSNHWHVCKRCGEINGKATHNMPSTWTNAETFSGQYRKCTDCDYTETKVAEITDSNISNVTDTEGNINLDVSGAAGTTPSTANSEPVTSVELSASTVGTINTAVNGDASNPNDNGTGGDLTITLGEDTAVSYDADAVAAIAEAVTAANNSATAGSDVTVTLVIEETTDGMQTAQTAAVENADNAVVYEITLEVTTTTTTGGTTTETTDTISDFKGGTATVTVPYEEEVATNEEVHVARVETSGTTTEMNSSYNATAGTVTWTTGSHSYYMIYTKEKAASPTRPSYPSVTYYDVTIAETSNGTVTASATRASSGTTITLTVTPADGYGLDSLTAGSVELKKASDTEYTFTMPPSDVTVTATFKQKVVYTDITQGSWYYDAVYYCTNKGYFYGTGDDLFSPNNTMTRAMFATVLYRIAGEPEATGDNPFTDVEADKWYTDAVIWAATNNIIGGYGGGIFGTDDPVTREQMVALFWRYNGSPTVENADLSKFTDANKISSWAREAMEWAVSVGIISGKGNGVLDPTGTAKRSEVAQIVMNYGTKVK